MQARLDREDHLVVKLLMDELRARVWRVTPVLTQVSEPMLVPLSGDACRSAHARDPGRDSSRPDRCHPPGALLGRVSMNLTSKGLLLIPLLALTACSSVWASGPTCRHTPIAVSNPGEQPSSPVAKLGRLGFVRDGDVWVQDLTLRSEQNLTHDGHSGFPRWSASGAWIGIGTQMSTAGVGGSANEQVVSMRWDGSERNVIGTGSIADVASAVWSPTGDRIAFIEADHGVVINADGSARVELANATSLAWSPDGAWLAYVKFERLQLGQDARRPFPHRVSIWRVRADGTDEHLVLDGGVPSPDFIEVAGWSPDRAEILFWRNTGFPAPYGPTDRRWRRYP